jgi:hypothetical protein
LAVDTHTIAAGARPSPPELLREMLAEDRAVGFTFEQAWTEDLEWAIRHASQRDGWREALEDTRDAYETAFHNAPGPAARLDLAMTYDAGEHNPTSTAFGSRL